MSRAMALSRVTCGVAVIAAMYAGPHAYGLATAGAKLDDCLKGAAAPGDVVVELSYIPGPTQIELLQRYGRYGGSGGNLSNVVLLGVPPGNVDLLARLYWVDRVRAVEPC